jgi:membrane-associated PAP2 superfamily phosphatase
MHRSMRGMQSAFASRSFLNRHLWFPLLAFIVVALVLELSTFDLWLADRFYALSGSSWSLREAWFTQVLIHDGGRLLVALLAGTVATAAVASLFAPRLARWRRGLWYVLGAALLSALCINLLKAFTHVACPWDLFRYGGALPYLHNFAPRYTSLSEGACFPAGHASAAYAWLGAYYVAREYAPQWKGAVLTGVLGMGLLFGFSQQLRGAHFISHDLWTLGICWGLATVLYLVAFRRSPPILTRGASFNPSCRVRPEGTAPADR